MSTVAEPIVSRSRSRPRLAVPPQHGAWAFLTLPLLLGLALAGVTWLGILFSVTWILAYPASFYLGRAVTVRVRRGSWSRIARRELSAALPWTASAAVGAVALVAVRPALLIVGGGLAVLWVISQWLAYTGRERGFGNDVLLVGQSVLALPLMWFVTTNSWAIPPSVWVATAVCGTYFVGSVIHVKSLIREADDPRWRRADLAFHLAALAWGTVSPWLLIPFGVALLRAGMMRPGLRPGVIGVVEMAVSLLVLGGTLFAVGG